MKSKPFVSFEAINLINKMKDSMRTIDHSVIKNNWFSWLLGYFWNEFCMPENFSRNSVRVSHSGVKLQIIQVSWTYTYFMEGMFYTNSENSSTEEKQNTFLIGLIILNKYLIFPGRLSKPIRSNPFDNFELQHAFKFRRS